jgi:hypothetical protein
MTDSDFASSSLNRYYLTLRSYAIDPRYLDGPGSGLGSGVDLSNPLRPKVAQFTAFRSSVQVAAAGYELPKSDNLIDEAFYFKEAMTEREESNVLSTSFKASYGLSSLQAAYDAAKKERESYHTIYAVLVHGGEAERLHDDDLYWKLEGTPFWESLANPDDVLFEFVEKYGSHYISAIAYGLRIAVQGKLKKDSKESQQTFSSSFKAAFGSFGAEASVRNEHMKKLESMNVEIMLEASSGGHTGGLLALRSFGEIARFFDDVKNNKIQFSVAPIDVYLSSYRATLAPDWKKIRDALDPRLASFKTPGAPYGVPVGTIIPWHPTADYVEGLESKNLADVRIVPPAGWAICDGTLGTPDLRGRFIRGTGQWTPTPPVGGAEQHAHGGKTQNNTATRDAHGGAGRSYNQPAERHSHVIEADMHLPPYIGLVYIMKLGEQS